MQIRNWTARRSGGRITIEGFDEVGRPIRVTAVDAIEAAKPYPIATRANGAEYQLVSDDARSIEPDAVAA